MAKQAARTATKTKAKSLDDIVGADETPAKPAPAKRASKSKAQDDALAQLQDDLDNAPETEDFPDAFRFEDEGDQLVGRVIAVDEIENEFGTYPVLTVVDSDGDMHGLHGLGTILSRELAKAEVGSLVAVRYQGEKQGNGGRTYKDYKAIVRKG